MFPNTVDRLVSRYCVVRFGYTTIGEHLNIGVVSWPDHDVMDRRLYVAVLTDWTRIASTFPMIPDVLLEEKKQALKALKTQDEWLDFVMRSGPYSYLDFSEPAASLLSAQACLRAVAPLFLGTWD